MYLIRPGFYWYPDFFKDNLVSIGIETLFNEIKKKLVRVYILSAITYITFNFNSYKLCVLNFSFIIICFFDYVIVRICEVAFC